MKRWLIIAALAGWAAPAVLAHVGSPDTIFDGTAGPYAVQVMVRAPGVVPGLAEINVWILDGEARQVAVRPVRWDAGIEGAPPADLATPVRGEPGLFTAELWLMTGGSYSIYVDVEGDGGSGTVIVPVVAEATERLGLMLGLAVALAVLGALLVAGAVTAVGAGVRESVLAPGEEPSARRRRAARVAAVVALAVIALALFGGKAWWDSEDARFAQRMFKPLPIVTAAASTDQGARTVSITIDDERFRRGGWSAIVPDHGKLMHAFLIREDGLDAFAHIHPVRKDHERFEVTVPEALPAGTYRVYADITHASGYAQTLTELVTVPVNTRLAPVDAPANTRLAPVDAVPDLVADPDDSWRVADVQSPTEHRFDDGSVLVFDRPETLVAGRPVRLGFRLRDAGGVARSLERYMGMAGHAAVRHHDGSVFIHLHPTGTVSMAAQQLFALRDSGQLDRGATEVPAAVLEAEMSAGAHAHHAPPVGERVTLPWAFPRPGTYRLWMQVKSDGEVYTGVYDVEVTAAEA